jgi:hypothetical protein
MSVQPRFWREVAASFAEALEFSELHLEQLCSLLLLWLNECASWEQLGARESSSAANRDPVAQSQCFNPFKDAWSMSSKFSSLASLAALPRALAATPSVVDSASCGGHTVYVHVYDVSQTEGIQKLNKILAHKKAPLKLGGVFHAGVEVNGIEWSFGFQPIETRYGVACTIPKRHPQHHFRQTVKMGLTEFKPEKVTEIISCMVEEYPGHDYDLLRRNCCHFADDFCRRLGVGGIPGWIHRLARVGAGVATMLEAAQSVGSQVHAIPRSFSTTLNAPECSPTHETLHRLRDNEWIECRDF